MTAAILSGHRVIPPFGLNGGEPGAIGHNSVKRNNGAIEVLTDRSEVQMQVGDVFENQEPRRKRTRYETATFGFLQTSQGTGNLPVTD